MKKIPILTVVLAALIVASCSTRAPKIANSIPDEAFAVFAMHPKKMHEKGQLATFESIKERIDNEVLVEVINDPVSSGIDINQYAYVFVLFEDDNPVIGATAVLKDSDKFNKMIQKLLEEGDEEIIEVEGYSMIAPDNDDAGMAWNDEQIIFLASTEEDKSTEEWKTALISLFDLEKEESVTSIVDFNDFSGKMKDMNIWFTGDQLQKVLEESGAMDNIDIDFPLEFYNNYGQLYMEFVDGAMYVHSETHFSDDVEKAAEMFLVAKDELNDDLLEITPGNDLLMAMAFSLELDKMVEMMKNFTPPEMDSVSNQIEQVTGMKGNEILDAMNGDFVVAINGAPEGSAIPVELLVGIGLDDASMQEKLMGQASNWADVQQDGDFFSINANGMEIYSGIINGVWVITNASGYKDAVTGGGLEMTLKDSKFNDYAGGSMGMYMNLDLTTYPAAIQAMMGQGGAPKMLELLTESLSFMAMEASNKQTDMTLKTAREDENSLYTLLKLMEEGAKNN